MRITGGEHRGRLLRTPSTPLRPTQDRVRAAAFSILAARVPDASVLDLFAGSGAYGIEALSRGAATADFLDADPRSAAAIRRNLADLRIPASAARVRVGDAFRLLRNPPPAPFDLVFADPPYQEAADNAWLPRLAALLLENRWLSPDSFFLYETDAPTPAPLPNLPLLLDRTYSATRLLLFRPAPPSA